MEGRRRTEELRRARGRGRKEKEEKDKDYDRTSSTFDKASVYAPAYERRREARGYGHDDRARQDESSRHAPVQILNRPRASEDGREQKSEARPKGRRERQVPKTTGAFTRCRFMDGDWRLCHDELEPLLLDGKDFLVVAALGAEKVGRSTILSTLVSQAEGNFQAPLSIHSAESFLEGQSSTGVDVCITMDRLVLLDAQPLFESFTTTDLRNELYLMIFLASICHCVLVVTDTEVDLELWRFLRLLATLKAKVPDLATWLARKQGSSASEVVPQLLVVLNQVENEEFVDFLQHTEWKAAALRCVAAPHLPGQGLQEMLRSDAAADLGRRLRGYILEEGYPGGVGGLELSEKEWLEHVTEYWDFVQKCDVQQYFDLLAAGRLKSLDSPDPKS